MFIERRKKKNYRTFIYAALIVFLCLVIVVIAWPEDSSVLAADSEQTDLQEQQEDKQTLNAGDFIERIENDLEEDEDEDEQDIPEVADIEERAETYYLVRREDDRIKVFFVNEEGSEIELETTEIIYDVLGPEDQKLFDEGFRVDTQEQLAVLLQDFES